MRYTLLTALARTLEPPELVIVRGREPELGKWQKRLAERRAPARLLFCIDDTAGALPGLLQAREPASDTVAYVCRGTTCDAPVSELDTLLARLAPSA
jgi:uncharacterized protein YyaL (SSP411 family)